MAAHGPPAHITSTITSTTSAGRWAHAARTRPLARAHAPPNPPTQSPSTSRHAPQSHTRPPSLVSGLHKACCRALQTPGSTPAPTRLPQRGHLQARPLEERHCLAPCNGPILVRIGQGEPALEDLHLRVGIRHASCHGGKGGSEGNNLSEYCAAVICSWHSSWRGKRSKKACPHAQSSILVHTRPPPQGQSTTARMAMLASKSSSVMLKAARPSAVRPMRPARTSCVVPRASAVSEIVSGCCGRVVAEEPCRGCCWGVEPCLHLHARGWLLASLAARVPCVPTTTPCQHEDQNQHHQEQLRALPSVGQAACACGRACGRACHPSPANTLPPASTNACLADRSPFAAVLQHRRNTRTRTHKPTTTALARQRRPGDGCEGAHAHTPWAHAQAATT